MQQRFHARASIRSAGAAAVSAIFLAMLSACGGGGGDSSPATVSAMNVSVTKYGVAGLITVTGTHLGNLAITAPGCKNVTRLTAAPTASSDTTAYFSCTPSGTYSSTVTASSAGATLSTQPLTVPRPIVTMTVAGDGVNGSIVFNLMGDKAPITVDNFLAYVNSGFYNGLIMHRVANFAGNPQSGFAPYYVVQGGTYGTTTGNTLPAPKTPTYDPIAFESGGGFNVQWTAGMARGTSLNSATSSFFFNLANNTNAFDSNGTSPGYAVFADVSGSAAVITAIAQAPNCTPLSGFNDGSCIPMPNVTITSAVQTQ